MEKVVVTHPRTGTKRNFDARLYEAFRAAIEQSLRKSRGKTFTELSDDVKQIIRRQLPSFKGSVPWYTISVRLDLESRGIVETFTEDDRKLSRLA